MGKKKTSFKKVIYIILLVVLALAFVAALTFGAIGVFATSLTEEIEVWYASKFEKDLVLLKTAIITLIVSSILLVFTLSFKDFKKKFID